MRVERPHPPDVQEIAEAVGSEWPFRDVQPAAASPHAMVATDAPLATQTGVEVLRNGGNAADAAVATAFALAVTHPNSGNVGGGGFATVRTASGEVAALDFREQAPLAATRDMFLDESGELSPRSHTGHLASGVPGTVAGLWELHRRYGSIPWPELVAPAVRLAEDGFVLHEAFVKPIVDDAERLRRFPASAALFLPGGEPVAVGSRWRNPDFASTLRRLARHGRAGFYAGETADLLVAEISSGGGLISSEDLGSYEARWRAPVAFTYRGHRVFSAPPPSAGGLTLALLANILEGYDLRRLGWHAPEALHKIAEAMRRAFAQRRRHLGDPDFHEIPEDLFLSKDVAKSLRATISENATPSATLSSDDDGSERRHTTHLSIVDGSGNAVALTTTLNDLNGSGVTVAGGGFLLNAQMDEFTAKVGTPTTYKLIQGPKNLIAPRKRMLSSIAPTIVVRDGKTLLLTGASGAGSIITGVFQILSNVVDFGFDLATAVALPRIHHQFLPDTVEFEKDGLTPEQTADLERRGHKLVSYDRTISAAASILRQDGVWTGVSDPRAMGLAKGLARDPARGLSRGGLSSPLG
jgi:gamma-glutamyltranspeptidase/glutathione hydrolase